MHAPLRSANDSRINCVRVPALCITRQATRMGILISPQEYGSRDLIIDERTESGRTWRVLAMYPVPSSLSPLTRVYVNHVNLADEHLLLSRRFLHCVFKRERVEEEGDTGGHVRDSAI